MRPLLLLLLLGVLGCAGAPPMTGEPGAEAPDPKEEARYQAALARASDHREVYSELDTKLFTAATYQSPEFREERLRRQAQFQTWPQSKLDEALARERAEAAQAHEVVFGVMVVDRKFDDFDAKQSIWRLTLVSDQGEVMPISIRRVGRSNLDLRAYYPYLGDFWVLYTARFPVAVNGRPLVGPGTQALLFRMSSSQAQVELKFPVGPGAAPGQGVPTPSPAAQPPSSR